MKSYQLSIALFALSGLLALAAPNGPRSYAGNDDKGQAQKQGPAQKTPPPADYVIPVPIIALVNIETIQDKTGTYNQLRINVENWKGYADGLFVQINKPYLPGCVNEPKLTQKNEPFPRMVTQLFDENDQRFEATCSHGSNNISQFKTQFFSQLKSKPLPKFVYLLLTDAKTGKQYKSHRVSLYQGPKN